MIRLPHGRFGGAIGLGDRIEHAAARSCRPRRIDVRKKGKSVRPATSASSSTKAAKSTAVMERPSATEARRSAGRSDPGSRRRRQAVSREMRNRRVTRPAQPQPREKQVPALPRPWHSHLPTFLYTWNFKNISAAYIENLRPADTGRGKWVRRACALCDARAYYCGAATLLPPMPSLGVSSLDLGRLWQRKRPLSFWHARVLGDACWNARRRSAAAHSAAARSLPRRAAMRAGQLIGDLAEIGRDLRKAGALCPSSFRPYRARD